MYTKTHAVTHIYFICVRDTLSCESCHKAYSYSSGATYPKDCIAVGQRRCNCDEQHLKISFVKKPMHAMHKCFMHEHLKSKQAKQYLLTRIWFMLVVLTGISRIFFDWTLCSMFVIWADKHGLTSSLNILCLQVKQCCSPLLGPTSWHCPWET